MGKTELKLDIDTDLLRQARDAGVDLASAVENGVRQALDHQPRGFGESPAMPLETADDRAHRWAAENADAIAEHNQRIAERGLIGSEWRRW